MRSSIGRTAALAVATMVATACARPEARTMAAPMASAPSAGLVSGIALENFDTGVRPQDDFYRYVNGKWLEQTVIPSDRSTYGAFTELSDRSEQDLKEIVEEAAAAEDAPAGSDLQKVGALYRSFMDSARIEALGVEAIRPELDRVAAVRSHEDLPRYWGEAARTGGAAPFGSRVSLDQKQSDRYITYMGERGLGLPNRDYYFQDGAQFDQLRDAYRAHIARMLKLGGWPDADAAASSVFDLEKAIADKHWTRVQNRDRNATYNKMSVAQADSLMGDIDLAAYLHAAGLEAADQVIVAQPTYFEALPAIVHSAPIETWKAYEAFHLLDGAAPMLSSAFVNASFDFNGRVLQGIAEQRPRWKNGVDLVGGSLRDVLGRLYVEQHFTPEAKAKMDTLVHNLLRAFETGIDNLDWMSPATRTEAKRKLANFTPKIGYPEKWEDYSSLEIREGDLMDNLRRVRDFRYQDNISRLGKPVDRTEWGMPPYMVNAYYNPVMNEVVFPAAILQPPFFNAAADDAVNYGAIGAVIGHEISHGFDDQGRKSDGEGNLRDWWTPEDAAAFQEKADRLVAQYTAYEPLPELHLNGQATLGENIGDLSGLTVAYGAYKISLAGKEAPVIDGLTGDQRFFLGWAQIWRTLYTDQALRNRIMTDPHSPGEYRTNGIVRHVPAFDAAFDVQPGDSMYLAPDQRVKIW